jgi:hypothetical protein
MGTRCYVARSGTEDHRDSSEEMSAVWEQS